MLSHIPSLAPLLVCEYEGHTQEIRVTCSIPIESDVDLYALKFCLKFKLLKCSSNDSVKISNLKRERLTILTLFGQA